MVYLNQYDYIFAIGTLFALLDAFNNGASEYLGTLLYPAKRYLPLTGSDLQPFCRRCSQFLGDQRLVAVHQL